ncbi:TetR/AcrR family transcriptional regulator [Candidatus Solincola tengchongensis]|uniref:TetR/AcrR family transcriptional regulator n=1 Tax=Candidatus Solincola tengchongensis TaxID=2900693 RepID=UPI00257B0CD2|nr:TetR/AcrR family transcriptional regulator [Candidatus Solincola tengchongensis]
MVADGKWENHVRSAESGRPKGRIYGGLTQEKRREARRSRLLEAGLELFSSEGYHRTPIERICERSHVATRHFYELYPGKEEFFRDLLDTLIEDSRRAVLEALRGEFKDPVEEVRAGISAFVRSYLDDPRRARVVLVEAVGISPEMERHRRELIHGFARIIEEKAEEMKRSGTLPDRDYSMGSLALAGAVNELMIDWVYSKSPPPKERVIEEIVDLFRLVIFGLSTLRDRL